MYTYISISVHTEIYKTTCLIVTAGLQSLSSSNIDKHTVPEGYTLGWNIGGSNLPINKYVQHKMQMYSSHAIMWQFFSSSLFPLNSQICQDHYTSKHSSHYVYIVIQPTIHGLPTTRSPTLHWVCDHSKQNHCITTTTTEVCMNAHLTWTVIIKQNIVISMPLNSLKIYLHVCRVHYKLCSIWTYI